MDFDDWIIIEKEEDKKYYKHVFEIQKDIKKSIKKSIKKIEPIKKNIEEGDNL